MFTEEIKVSRRVEFQLLTFALVLSRPIHPLVPVLEKRAPVYELGLLGILGEPVRFSLFLGLGHRDSREDLGVPCRDRGAWLGGILKGVLGSRIGHGTPSGII